MGAYQHRAAGEAFVVSFIALNLMKQRYQFAFFGKVGERRETGGARCG